MTIEIGDGRYFIGFWWAGIGGEYPQDYLATVYRDAGGVIFTMKYRFRHHRDAKVWDSKDEKNWYVAGCGEKTETEMEAIMDVMLAGLVEKGMRDATKIALHTDDARVIMAALQKLPWVNMRVEAPKAAAAAAAKEQN